jgi:hypothetical protein
MAPALLPESMSGTTPNSFKAFNTPKWATPRAPPPDNAIPVVFKLILFIK